jgi:hypothetical protein
MQIMIRFVFVPIEKTIRKNDHYKCAHRFYSLHNKIRYVHTYYKNKDRRKKNAQQIRLFKKDKAHIYKHK